MFQRCHSDSFAVILSAAKDLALPAQDKLREESRQLVIPTTTEILRFAQNDMPRAFFQQPPKVSQPWVTEPSPGFLAGLFEPLNPAPIEPTVLPPG